MKTEPSASEPDATDAGTMEVDTDGPAEGSVETGKVKSWQLKKRMPGCKYETLLNIEYNKYFEMKCN